MDTRRFLSRRWKLGLAAAVSGALLAAAAATVSTAGEPQLPTPDGRSPVGTVSLHLIDEQRDDPEMPSGKRELMMQLWYPAGTTRGKDRAAYLSPAAADAFGFAEQPQTHSYSSAPVSRGGWRIAGRELPRLPWQDRLTYPVVVYSHGHGTGRALGTALIEEMASRGYVVAAIDHPYDAAFVEYPGGRLVEAKLDQLPVPEGNEDLALWDEIIDILLPPRVADVRFVLDQLELLQTGQNPDAQREPLPGHLAGALDLSRIGMVGHSMGGTTAAQTLLDEPRMQAGLLLDSGIPQRVRQRGLDRPIMLMKSEQPDPEQILATTWQLTPKRGWHRGLRLTGSGHNTYTDLSALCYQSPECEEDLPVLGSIDGRRAITIQRAYLSAFLDQHLRGQPQKLLDEPSTQYPEIQFLPE